MNRTDKHWQTLNKHLEKYMKTNDFFMMGTTYYEMADFLKSEDKKLAKKYRELGYKMKIKAFPYEKLREFQESGYDRVEILSAEDSCSHCKKLNRKRFNTKKEISKALLPIKECTHKYGCRCIYLPVTALSDNNKLVHWDSSKQKYTK